MNHLSKAHPISPARTSDLLKDSQSFVYHKTAHGELKVHLFFPDNHQSSDQRASALFFHGGQWDKPMITQFVPQCLHLSMQGMIAGVVEYRLEDTHQTSPLEAIEDARAAMIWLRRNAAVLGADPEKVVAVGAGSGAHLALDLAMLPPPSGEGVPSTEPQAMILFSAIVDTTHSGVCYKKFPKGRFAYKTSPSEWIRRKLPPSLFFHGKLDVVAPITHVKKFTQLMKSKRNICDLIEFENATHSFFNFNVNQQHFEQCLNCMDLFLVQLGFISEQVTHEP
ncbi:alpha/beta hydrolase [Persicirhabdus sediminis]|uniref:Alpha/beta hydrolase n=1 Tax=Persicirhabdus sediminis TaxID=454144 RepID=A0A8J7SMP9_9BACT|nr:alpha/beta hydrolase [Persicirhabdus sediminis]MBK1791238.1 alpha/beta hydrolase [Persicirhabdus sediminis]